MIIASDGPAVTIPEITVTEYVLRHAARLADKPALIDGPSGRALTYGQLADGNRRVATGRAQHGFRRGDVLAIYSPNVPEYAVVFNAVASLGGSSTTINPLYTADELARQLIDSGARIIVTVPAFLDKPGRQRRKRRSRKSSSSGRRKARVPSPSCCRRRRARRGSASIRPSRSSRCRTRAGPPACPRASCSRIATSWRTSSSSRA